MNIKKIIGYVLVFIGITLLTGILVEISSLEIVMMSYGITILIILYISLAV